MIDWNGKLQLSTHICIVFVSSHVIGNMLCTRNEAIFSTASSPLSPSAFLVLDDLLEQVQAQAEPFPIVLVWLCGRPLDHCGYGLPFLCNGHGTGSSGIPIVLG